MENHAQFEIPPLLCKKKRACSFRHHLNKFGPAKPVKSGGLGKFRHQAIQPNKTHSVQTPGKYSRKTSSGTSRWYQAAVAGCVCVCVYACPLQLKRWINTYPSHRTGSKRKLLGLPGKSRQRQANLELNFTDVSESIARGYPDQSDSRNHLILVHFFFSIGLYKVF